MSFASHTLNFQFKIVLDLPILIINDCWIHNLILEM